MSHMEKLVLGLSLISFVFLTLTRLLIRKISVTSVVTVKKVTMITIMLYIVILNGVHTNCPWWFCAVMMLVFSYLGVLARRYNDTQNRWAEVSFESETVLSNFQTFINSTYAQERLIKLTGGKSTTYILNEVYYKSNAVFVINEKRITMCAAFKCIKRFERYLNSKQPLKIPVL